VPDESAFGDAGPDRRAFLKRLIIGTAFVVPVVSSFTMSGVTSVFADTPGSTTLATNTNTTTTTSTTTTSTTVPVSTTAPTSTTQPSQSKPSAAPAITSRPNFTG
jgi:hypothetical protein